MKNKQILLWGSVLSVIIAITVVTISQFLEKEIENREETFPEEIDLSDEKND